MTNEERKYLLEETKRAQANGFEGSVLDVFRNPNVLQEFQAQSVLQPTQGSNIQIASTPEEQQQGLSGVPANQMPEAMVFPNVKPNTSFNTVGMKAPINIEKRDEQGHLVKSYKNVPVGITNLPMGPQGGTVIETPSKRQSGGIMQPKGDPWEYKYEDGNYLTRRRGSENWLTAKGTALEAIKSKVYKQPVTTQPQSESTQPSPRPDQKRQSAPAPTKPKAKVETPQALDRNFPETGSEDFELIPGLNIGAPRQQPAPQEPAAPTGRASLPRFDIGVRPNAAQADNTRTATPELRGPSLNPPKFDELGRPIELRQEEARRAQQTPAKVTPASPNYRPKIEQPKIEDTEPSWTESAEAWVDEKISGAQRLIGRVLPADEESLIEVPTENIIIPKVESKDLPIQETYTELGKYPDRGGRELASFAHTFDNIEGGTYRIGPKVRELYDERGNLREGSQTSISGVAVAHFLRDSDISENQQFAPPSWEIGSSDYEMRNASTEGKLIGYTEAQMKDPERYRMMYRKNEDGTYSVKYKQLKNIGEADAEWAYDLPVSRQHRFSDIDWDKKGKSTGYQALGGRTYYIPLKANAQNISSEGKFDHTSIPVGDPTEFSRFSGGSIVLLFKDPKTGREIGVDVSGSKDALRDTGRKLIKQYGLKEEDVTVAYHDMGSYSAKPAAKDGKLDYNQWYDYNQYNRGMSGAPLVIANQQAGGVKRYQSGGRKKYQSGSPTEYFEQKPLTSSDFDYTTDRSRGNARFFGDPVTGEPFPLVNLPEAEVVAQRTPYNQLSNQSLLAGVSQAKPWFEAGNKEMGYEVLKKRKEDLERASFINEFTGIPAMGRTADRVQNDPADLFTFEGGLDMLGFVRPLSAANKGAKALARQASPLAKDAGKFLATQTPKQLPGSGNVDEISKLNFSNKLSTTKNQLSKALKGTSSVLDELKGELLQGKINRESIKKGNEWLENWIKHPATKEKINTDIDAKIDFVKQFYNNPIEETDLLNLIRTQSRNFKPNSKEYTLLKQLDDNLQQYLSKKSRGPIHQGNWGVSYQHSKSPQYRKAVEEGLEQPFDRYGSWISRTTKLPQAKRISTTIHEGAHDWVSEEAFKKSGMRNTALKNMNPKIKDDFLEWERYNDFGVDPVEKMGRERAYQAYLADPTEQHARIMELRYDLGITPDYKMDLEDAEKVLKWIDEGGSKIDPKFLNVIDKDPKKLAELFNKFWMAPAAIGAGAAAVAGSEPKMKDLGKVTFQTGGLPGEFMYKSQSAAAPLAYTSPTANGYLLPDPNRPELMNTGATEYKMGVDDVTIPTVVNGNYMNPETAYQRYKLTGEKFKPTADPSAYSKFYDEVNKLGIMKYRKGGPKKYQSGDIPPIVSLPEVEIAEPPSWKVDREKLTPDKINWWESFNFKKWGLNDYSDFSSFNSAFRNARESKEDKFIWKGKRFNTELAPKEVSERYFDSKKFLEDYYTTEPFFKQDTSAIGKLDTWKGYTTSKYGTTWSNYYDKVKDLPNTYNEGSPQLDTLSMLAEPQFYKNFPEEAKAYAEKATRDRYIQALNNPYYFSITSQPDPENPVLGYHDSGQKKLYISNTEPTSKNFNTTSVHELSHKADIEDRLSYTTSPRIPEIDINKLNTFGSSLSQDRFDYITDPTETEARKMSTLYYMSRALGKDVKSGQIKQRDLDELYKLMDASGGYYSENSVLPSDILDILELYKYQQADLLKYLNNDFSYSKRKQSGGKKAKYKPTKMY